MTALVVIVLWILCGIGAARIMAAMFRIDQLTVNDSDAWFFLVLGLLGGPISLPAAAFAFTIAWLGNRPPTAALSKFVRKIVGAKDAR